MAKYILLENILLCLHLLILNSFIIVVVVLSLVDHGRLTRSLCECLIEHLIERVAFGASLLVIVTRCASLIEHTGGDVDLEGVTKRVLFFLVDFISETLNNEVLG